MHWNRFLLPLSLSLACLGCATERAAQFQGTARGVTKDGGQVNGPIVLAAHGHRKPPGGPGYYYFSFDQQNCLVIYASELSVDSTTGGPLGNHSKIEASVHRPDFARGTAWFFKGKAVHAIEQNPRSPGDTPDAFRLCGRLQLVWWRDAEAFVLRADLADQQGWGTFVRGDFAVASHTRFVPGQWLLAVLFLFGVGKE